MRSTTSRPISGTQPQHILHKTFAALLAVCVLTAGIATGAQASPLPEAAPAAPIDSSGYWDGDDAELEPDVLPVFTSMPTIDGRLVVGSKLSTDDGEGAEYFERIRTWLLNGVAQPVQQDPDEEFDSSVTGGTPFTIPADAVGKRIGLTITAINSYGRTTAVTVEGGIIKPASFTRAPSPAISGTVHVGNQITASSGSWSPSAKLSYQWYRNGSTIQGATGAKYRVGAADSSARLKVRIRAALTGYVTTDRFSTEKTVPSTRFSKTAAPSMSGTVRVGSKVTAKPGVWSPKPSFTYQWYRSGRTIKGATKSSYTPSAADRGKKLKVRVTARKGGLNATSRYSSQKTVAAGSLKPRSSVSVRGSARYGSIVRANAAWPSGTKVSYQWVRDGKSIKGAKRGSIKLRAADIGHRVAVRATASKAGYATYRSTSRTIRISSALFSVKSNPKIGGTKRVGYTLRTTAGSFSPKPTGFAYRWYRSGKPIKNATRSTYRLVTADTGKKITVRVTAKRKYFTGRTAQSATTTVPIPPRTVISRDGTYRVGSSIKPGLYRAAGSGGGCYWARTSGFSGSTSQIKANYFGAANTYVRIVSGDKGFTTSGCGKWTTVSSSGAKSNRISRDGTYRIGIDVRAGTYVGTSRGDGCYWAVLDDLTGSAGDITENYFGSARTVVDVPSYATAITVSGCGTLTRG